MKDEKLNVLALVQLPPPIHGAALRNKDLVNSDVFNSACNVLVVPIQTATEIKDIGVFNVGKLISLVRMVFLTLKTLIFTKVDVCYITLSANGFAFYKDVFLILVAKLFGKKVVCHMRNRGLNNYIGNMNFFSRVAATSVLKRCKYICMSNNLSSDITSVSNNPKIISNCLTRSTEFISESIVSKRFSSKNIVYLSNIAESKGSLLFLDIVSAVNALSREKYGCEIFNFKVFGPFFSPQEKDKFEYKISSLGLINVEIMGPIYGEEKFSALRDSALMIFPTKYEKECFPGVIMEAFSCSVPVISRAVAAVPEIINNGVNGFYFYDDPAMYANAILDIFSDISLYSKLCHGASDSYDKNMRYQVVHEKIYEYLKMVAE